MGSKSTNRTNKIIFKAVKNFNAAIQFRKKKCEKLSFFNKLSSPFFRSQMDLLRTETTEKVEEQGMIIKCIILHYSQTHFREDLSGSNNYES